MIGNIKAHGETDAVVTPRWIGSQFSGGESPPASLRPHGYRYRPAQVEDGLLGPMALIVKSTGVRTDFLAVPMVDMIRFHAIQSERRV